MDNVMIVILVAFFVNFSVEAIGRRDWRLACARALLIAGGAVTLHALHLLGGGHG